eukprot:CAMPEP_0202503254 /NCGR_PEP_ID=MMETSP1361-20130828/41338_1 /ASSEMBLY_ACC=CAM_ASM_000849 /TAXON_ID=210615 /ORGANISM="Staurosira complex sp., Strain CCMP2646" /LENGTH=233 /DNA_ID=CAMNT_0049136433 /DNA_START=21 /DNA_END=722 /DNA_ORIENTATION=-
MTQSTNDPNDASNEPSNPIIIDTQDLPPLRLHATRVVPLLSSSASLPNNPTTHHQRRRSFDRNKNNPRSRSKSPSLKQQQDHTTTTVDGGSSLSSLEDFVNLDILTDKQGMMELSLKDEERKTHQLHQSSGSLAPVHERMSEETLEDSHAFNDVKTPSLSSRGNSTVGTAGDVGSYLLETLDECEEDEEDALLVAKNGEVIFTNMENLTIHEEQGDGNESLECSSAPATFKTV